MWAWGSNKQGELGTGISASTDDRPAEIADLGNGNAGLAGGVDGTHEISLGAKDSTGCVAPFENRNHHAQPGQRHVLDTDSDILNAHNLYNPLVHAGGGRRETGIEVHR